MKTILVLVGATLLGTAACRERPTHIDDQRVTAGKPIEADDDFIQARSTFQTTTKERLGRLDVRIEQLDSRTDPAGHSAAIQLRARRDEIARRTKNIEQQRESTWDAFQADTTKLLDQLEQDVDRLVD